MPEAADAPAVERCAVRLAGVLDDREPVPLGDRGDRGHVRGQAEQVDRADRLRARRDRRLDPVSVDHVRVRLDVDEDRRRSGREDRTGGRVERVTDRDHLVTGSEPHAGVDDHQRDRPVGDRDRVADTDVLRPVRLELGDLRALGEHPAAQDVGDGGDLLFADIGTDEGIMLALLAR